MRKEPLERSRPTATSRLPLYSATGAPAVAGKAIPCSATGFPNAARRGATSVTLPASTSTTADSPATVATVVQRPAAYVCSTVAPSALVPSPKSQ